MKTKYALAATCLLLSMPLQQAALAQGTAFTYQGQLQNNSTPAGGTYNLTFSLYTNSAGGTPMAGPVTNSAVNVTNGLFTVVIDFGSSAWNGATNWLEISVETNGGGSFTTLSPRQELTPTPYAITAENLNGTVGAGGLSGTYGGAVNFTNPANSFTGNGAGLTNVNATTVGGLTASNLWQTGGNTGTSPTSGNFLGTIDIQPLELHAGGLRALRLEPDPRPVPESANIIGGFTNNVIEQPGSGGDVIVGGGYDAGVNVVHSNSAGVFIGAGSANQIGPNVNDSVIGGGFGNNIRSGDSVIAGGYFNTIQSNSSFSTIAGGDQNSVNGGYSAIVGGLFNVIQSNLSSATIAGGYGNTIGPDGTYSVLGGGNFNVVDEFDSVIGGGQNNFIQIYADHSFIGGGYSNVVVGAFTGPAVAAVIGGGQGNVVQTNAYFSVIGGGYGNTIQSNTFYAMIAGGSNNVAGGIGSFAAGTSAQATNSGAFVWADNSTTNSFSSTGSNQFAVRATGGIQLVTGGGTGLGMNGQNVTFSNNTTSFVTGFGTLAIVEDNVVPGITASGSLDNGLYSGHMRFRNALEIWPNSLGTIGGYMDVRGANGIQTIWMSGTNGNITCTTLTQTSDRNAKQDFAPVSPAQVLDKVLELPVSEWSYKVDAGPRHIGPMAQDFYSIFKIGADEKHIAPIDEGGVAFAAIQGLNEKAESGIRNAERQIEELRGENAELRARLEALEKIVHAQKQN